MVIELHLILFCLNSHQLVQLQVELRRMNAENQRLRGMLTQVSNNYTALQMHLVTLMQQQQISRAENDHEVYSSQELFFIIIFKLYRTVF